MDKDINLDPAGDWMVPHIDVFNILYDTLYRVTAGGEIVPNLTTDFPEVSADGTRYTIHLKPNVLFHDDPCFPKKQGRPLRASDVVYSLKRIADPTNETGLWSILRGHIKGLDEFREAVQKKRSAFKAPIEGLRVLDDMTLELTLNHPLQQIFAILSMPSFSIVAQEAVEHYGDNLKYHAVGTGPFRLESYSARQIVVARQSNHWRNPAKTAGDTPRGILFRFYNDPWAAFQDGELDLISIDNRRLHAYLDEELKPKPELKSRGYGVKHIREALSGFVIFNHSKPLLQNIHLRRAIAHAVPWQRVKEPPDLLTASFVPQGVPGALELQYEWSPERALEELALAGYPNGKGLPELTIRARWPVRIFMAGMLEDALEAVGIPARIDYQEKDALEEADLGAQTWLLDYVDAMAIFSMLHSQSMPPAGNNYGSFSDTHYDAMLAETGRLTGTERIMRYEAINRWLYDNVIIIPYRQTYLFYGTGPRIGSLVADPLGNMVWPAVSFNSPDPSVGAKTP